MTGGLFPLPRDVGRDECYRRSPIEGIESEAVPFFPVLGQIMPSAPRRPWYPAIVLGLLVAGLGLFALVGYRGPVGDGEAMGAQVRYQQIPFDGRAAMADLERVCALGPRPSGSEAMQKQQTMLAEFFTGLGARVSRQTFRGRHPQTGEAVEMANLVVEWFPEATERYLLCAHYDTRPFPDRDPVQPRGKFVGANDGGSGTAVLMELGRHMQQLKGRKGVDFVLFDGEELVFGETDPYFLGSTHFAQTYRLSPPSYRYRAGLLLDMVGDARLLIRKEPISKRYARFVVDDVWGAAARIGVSEFDFHDGLTEVRDDHVPLNEIARIPTADVIDFDYPYWHTEGDTPDKCSAVSLEKVGKVVYEWLRTVVNR